MKIVVVSVPANGRLGECDREACACAARLVKNIPGATAALWIFGGGGMAVRELPGPPFSTALWVRSATFRQYDAELLLAAMEQVAAQRGGGLFLFGGSLASNELAPRLAYRLGGQALLGCTQIANGLHITRPVFGGNLDATVALQGGAPYFITLAPGAYKADTWPAPAPGYEEMQWQATVPSPVCSRKWRGETSSALFQKDTLVVVGRGVDSKDGMALVYELAAALDADVGGSRPAVMNALVPVDHLVGQSGRTVAPRLCVLVGVSGATPLMTGVEGAQTIVAINKDENAPVLGRCDLGIVGDYQEVIPVMLDVLAAQGQEGGT